MARAPKGDPRSFYEVDQALKQAFEQARAGDGTFLVHMEQAQRQSLRHHGHLHDERVTGAAGLSAAGGATPGPSYTRSLTLDLTDAWSDREGWEQYMELLAARLQGAWQHVTALTVVGPASVGVAAVLVRFLPYMQYLNLAPCYPVTGELVAWLRVAPRLRELHVNLLAGPRGVENAEYLLKLLAQPRPLAVHGDRLRCLELYNAHDVEPAHLHPLWAAPHLEHVQVHGHPHLGPATPVGVEWDVAVRPDRDRDDDRKQSDPTSRAMAWSRRAHHNADGTVAYGVRVWAYADFAQQQQDRVRRLHQQKQAQVSVP